MLSTIDASCEYTSRIPFTQFYTFTHNRKSSSEFVRRSCEGAATHSEGHADRNVDLRQNSNQAKPRQVRIRTGGLVCKCDIILYWNNPVGDFVAKAPEFHGGIAHGDFEEGTLLNVKGAVDL